MSFDCSHEAGGTISTAAAERVQNLAAGSVFDGVASLEGYLGVGVDNRTGANDVARPQASTRLDLR